VRIDRRSRFELTDEERETLVRWSRRHSSSQALALRSRIVLACADGRPDTEIADELGCDRVTVCRWRHRFAAEWLEGWSISSDSDLIEKIRDLVGLFMSPPVAAAVHAVDEKPQIQALNRSAPILPMLSTTPQKATHDYLRNGTLDLFAALEVATGMVITDLRKSTPLRTSSRS
jgi:Homeodomain-like domain